MHSFNRYFILILFLAAVSCSDNNNEQIIEKLQGDWIPSNIDEGYFLSFKGDMISNSENEFAKYYIKGDTIVVPKYWGYTVFKMPFRKVTEQFLCFNQITKIDLSPYISTDINNNENIILKDIEIHFQNDFYFSLNRWAIYLNDSLDCFLGAFNIRNSGKGSPTVPEKKGTYYSRLTMKEFEFIQRKVRNIDLPNLKDTYGSFENDRSFFGPPVIYLLIHYRSKNSNEIKEVKLRFIGYENSPTTVAILINYLHQLHYFLSFRPTNKTHNFKHINTFLKPNGRESWDFEDR